MLPQIVGTLINWLSGKAHQSYLLNGSYGKLFPRSCQGFRYHPSGDFFIPQRLTPDSGDLLSQSMIQAKESTGSLEIWDLLAAMPTDPSARCIAVIGNPGSGKTTLLEHLQRTYAENLHKQIHSGVPNLIPVRLCLQEILPIITSDRPPSLLELIAPGENPEKHLARGDYLVMFDGLDEINGLDEVEGRNNLNHGISDRDRISHWIEQQMQTYLQTPFIVTSSSNAYHQTPLENVGMVLELQPFNDRQIQQFLHSWYQLNPGHSSLHRSQDMKNREKIDRLLAQIKSVRSLANMATNPLLLKAIVQVHDTLGQVPSCRVELYGVLCDILLTTSVEDCQIVPAKKSFLQKLGLGLMQHKTSQFTSNSLRRILGKHRELFANLEIFCGLLVEVKPGVYEFAHKSFQEYLAGVEIKESQQEKLLIKNIQNPWWHETIKFYTSISKNENTNVIQASLSEPTTLNLAYSCLQDNLNVPLSLRQEFEDKLTAALESSNPSVFRSAAKIFLKERCKKLLKPENFVAIDSGYITNAEYQLFIDDRRKVGQSRQPDHWPTTRFATGKSREAIAGVRGSDAEEFCEWLTQQYAGLGIRFRLPTLTEVQTCPALEGHLGAWCYDAKEKAIGGFSPELLQQWQQQIAIAIEHDLKQLNCKQNSLKLDITRSLTRNLAFTLARANKDWLVEQISQKIQQGNSHDIVNNLKNIQELVFCLGNVDNFPKIREFALSVSKTRQFFSLRKLIRTTQLDVEKVRGNLLLIYICFNSLDKHKARKNKSENSAQSTLTLRQSTRKNSYYDTQQDEALNLYAFFLLFHQRHFNNFAAFEGIRIVKELLE